MTKQEAVDLSILKWEYIVKHDGRIDGLIRAIPEVALLRANCGLCQYQYDKHQDINGMCSDCPLFILDKIPCGEKGSSYVRWFQFRNKVNAEIVLNLIKQIKI